VARITPLPLEDARRIGAEYGLDVTGIEALDAGSVNSNFRLLDARGRAWFGRIYEEQAAAGARREVALARALALAGVPVAPPLARVAGGDLAEHRGKAVALFGWVDGVILCQARVTPDACRAVGGALATVHLATARVPGLGAGRFGVDDLLSRLSAVEAGAPAELVEAARQIRPKLVAVGRARHAELPAGLVHGDLFRDNVLWQGERIVALLDFESASHGVFAYDLAVTLMAWCYSSRFEPELVRALFAGYRAVRELESAEVAGLRAEAALGALRFATTRITDYSLRAPPGQAPKRDYRRFLGRLQAIEAGALDVASSRG
jgi:homoserine kinase type II